FRCEFCDIIVMFGRKPRTKTVDQVRAELDLLRSLGAKNLFFVDDNFIGNIPQARDLLRFIAGYQKEHGHPFRFGTEASLNLAQHEDLMTLFREANFQWVFIGIESPDPDSLRETLKLQNLREDILTSLRKIYSHGIDIFAGFIIGFDHDTVATFDHQNDFIMQSGIQVAMVGLLTALPRTPLYERLRADGRLLPDEALDNTRLATNVVPKGMTMDQMRRGYQQLYRRLSSHRAIADRIRVKLNYLPETGQQVGYALRDALPILTRFVASGMNPGGWSRWWHFLRTLAVATPRQVPFVVGEWITGLSMKAYAEKFVVPSPEVQAAALEKAAARLQRKLRAWIDSGALEVQLDGMRTNLAVTLHSACDSTGLARAARNVARVLRETRADVTLRIEACEAPTLQRIIRRLRRDGDRVSLSLSEKLRGMVEIDTSRFHLVFEPSKSAARPE
ncbi:MAG TPA: radical SAM protein, partial [Thermoanaerobaculia bacterium]